MPNNSNSSPADEAATDFSALPRGSKLVQRPGGLGVVLPLPGESARLSTSRLVRALVNLGVPVADPNVDKRIKAISRFVGAFGATRRAIHGHVVSSVSGRMTSSVSHFEEISRVCAQGTVTGRIPSSSPAHGNRPQSAEGARYYKR
jgi:hypothetical protein